MLTMICYNIIKNTREFITIIAVYVDDIIITRNCIEHIKIEATSPQNLSINDLGIEVHQVTNGIVQLKRNSPMNLFETFKRK